MSTTRRTNNHHARLGHLTAAISATTRLAILRPMSMPNRQGSSLYESMYLPPFDYHIRDRWVTTAGAGFGF